MPSVPDFGEGFPLPPLSGPNRLGGPGVPDLTEIVRRGRRHLAARGLRTDLELPYEVSLDDMMDGGWFSQS